MCVFFFLRRYSPLDAAIVMMCKTRAWFRGTFRFRAMEIDDGMRGMMVYFPYESGAVYANVYLLLLLVV